MTEIPTVAFVADSSGTGKTTLLINVLKILKGRGYRVGTVKHALHEVRIDKEGSDSWYHAQAGADICVIAGKSILVTQRRKNNPSLEDALEQASRDMDIVLVEGFKDTSIPKIEVYRSGHSRRLLCKDQESAGAGLIAVASDVPLDVPIPVLPLNDPAQVCGFIVEHFLNNNIEI